MNVRHAQLQRARLYLVVSPEVLGPDWGAAVAVALASRAVDILQLRAKTWRDDKVHETAVALRAACHEVDALFVLNDRPDLALAADADGVHVGEDDTSVAQARAVLGPDRIIGCSTHDARELGAVSEADYAGLGPCFPTASKRLSRAPGGRVLLESALSAAPPDLPVFPIGGIDANNLPALIAAGACRAAVGAGVLAQSDPARAARTLRALLQATLDARSGSGPTQR